MSQAIVDKAIEKGINFFDTAEVSEADVHTHLQEKDIFYNFCFCING